MKKSLLICCICLLFVILLCGCIPKEAANAETTTNPEKSSYPDIPDGICPPLVMIDGKLYCDWSLKPVIDPNAIGEEEILGYISTAVSSAKLPTKNGEANYGSLRDAPYARWTDETYGEVYVIKYGYGWHILVPEGYPIG